MIHWFPELCSHAGKCWQLLPEVFDVDARPWIRIDAASPEEIIKVIDQCPSGALKYSLPPGSEVDPAIAQGAGWLNYDKFCSPEVRLRVVKNGPLLVDGRVSVVSAKGDMIQEGSKMALCRCGLSHNKPFCDGTHFKAGWTDESE